MTAHRDLARQFARLLMTLAMKATLARLVGDLRMLEHFISMANAGKMDAQTFIGEQKAVGNCMSDRAMIPAVTGRRKCSERCAEGSDIRGLESESKN